MNKLARMMTFTGILLGMVASILMQTVLATVLPDIAKELGGAHLYAWVFSSYMVASTITIPIFAKLADLYGRKLIYLGGMVVFLIGSALCGTTTSMTSLIFFRIIQGLGAGALAPSAIALISYLFTIKERGKMFGLLASVQVLANVTGPILGGLVADNFGWRWAFFANLPIGLLAIIFLFLALSEPVQGLSALKFEQVDFAGGLLLGLSTVLVIVGINQAGAFHLQAWQFWASPLLALLIFTCFIWQEQRHPDPVVPAQLVALRNVHISMLSAFLLGTVMYGATIILPLYGQLLFGQTALQGGKLLLALPLGMGVGGLLSGQLTNRFSYTQLAISGWSLIATGFLLLAATVNLNLTYLPLAGIVMLTGLGLGITLPSFLLPAQNAVTDKNQAVVGGLVQLCRNVGGAIGVPMFTFLLTITKGVTVSSVRLTSFRTVFLLMALGSVLGLATGLRFRGSSWQDQVTKGGIKDAQ